MLLTTLAHAVRPWVVSEPRAWLCVTGAAGGISSLAVKYAKFYGRRVVAIDSKQKKHHYEALGLDLFVDYEIRKMWFGA
jgi:D-arabinose 1-dehydrogenase-like Zn-dependent alcohol dehydrogenase